MLKTVHLLAAFAAISQLAAGVPPVCHACSVPVFRYALERWSPDPYEVVIFHRGTLSSDHTQLLQTLAAETIDGHPLTNLNVIQVDLDQDPAAEQLILLEGRNVGDVPHLVVQTPARSGPKVTVWAGDLSEQSVRQLVTSPARHELAERILKGDSVVWVLLEGGDSEQDDAAFATLRTELDRLQRMLKLPEMTPDDAQELGIESGSLKLAFSVIRVSRDDPADRILVDILLRVESDLLDAEYDGMPMAFPVFGRGRVLHALVGAGISGALIEDSSRFLTGACQCTVKAENPGVDLVMSVDWDALVQPTMDKDTELPPLAGLSGFITPHTTAHGNSKAEPADTANTLAAVGKAASGRTDAPADEALPGSIVSMPADVQRGSADFTPVVTSDRSGAGVGRNAMLVVLGLGLIVVVGTAFVGRRGGSTE